MWRIRCFYKKCCGFFYYRLNRRTFSVETCFLGIPRIHRKEHLFCGKGLKVNTNVFINADGGVVIGNEVTLSHGVTILAASYNIKQWCKKKRVHENRGIRIGNHVWIGANAMILDGVTICDNVIIGAGAVVNKNIMDTWSVYAGNPARKIKDLR